MGMRSVVEVCGKVALFVVNAVALCAGIAIVVIASILISKGSSFEFLLNDDTFNLPIFALVISILIIAICFLGCYGAFAENKRILLVYAVILFLLFVAEVVIGSLITVNANIPTDEIQKDMDKVFEQYGNSSLETLQDIDSLQHSFQCCGVRDFQDWATYPWGEDHPKSVPDSCCVYDEEGCGLNALQKPHVKDLIYTKGCYYIIQSIIGALELVLGVVCIIIAIIQVVSIICASGLAFAVGRF